MSANTSEISSIIKEQIRNYRSSRNQKSGESKIQSPQIPAQIDDQIKKASEQKQFKICVNPVHSQQINLRIIRFFTSADPGQIGKHHETAHKPGQLQFLA